MKLVIEIGDEEKILTMEKARKLYEGLKEIFEKEKEFVSYPVYVEKWKWQEPYIKWLRNDRTLGNTYQASNDIKITL